MTNINKQDRKKLCLERAVLFISNLWELSDKELDTIKDLALQGGATERICLSVQNCNSKAETSYRFNLKGPMLSLTLNPPSAEAHTCVRLLLLLSSIRAVNPAQSLITKRRRKKTGFSSFPSGCGPQLDKGAFLQSRVKLQTDRRSAYPPLKWFFFIPSLVALPVCSSAALDPTLSCSTPPTLSSGSWGIRHTIPLSGPGPENLNVEDLTVEIFFFNP